MFNSKTLFIVGAGASKEAGLPIGDELTMQIANLVDFHVDYRDLKRGDRQIFDTLGQLARREEWTNNKFTSSGRAIAEAMVLAPSIDTFLETHRSNPEFVLIGKLGIAKAIAEAECKSLLAPKGQHRERPFNLSELSGTWYERLARQLFTGVPVEEPELAFQNVDFIVFNYDRCLQTYLVQALVKYFRIGEEHAARIIADTKFVHPYGSLGSSVPGSGHVPFAPTSLDLEVSAGQLRTYSESSATSEDIQALVRAANTLVFLGFAFHPANMALIDPQERIGLYEGPGKTIYATSLGLSPSDEAVVTRQLATMIWGATDKGSDRIFMNNGTCAELFSTYWRSLTA